MKKIYQLLFTCIAAGPLSSSAQTDPAPFDLSAGDYSFTEWLDDEAAGTYPPSMVFHFTREDSDPQFNPLATGTQDFNCAYNLTSRPRVNGLGEDGIGMVNTGSGQFNDCISGTASVQRYMGVAVLALNTTGRTDVEVLWTGGTVTVGSGGTPGIPRIFSWKLQYRIGTEGDFAYLEGQEYVSGEVGHSQEITSVLPSECDDQPVVQLRWQYIEHETSPEDAAGTRPQLRLDDITVTSEEDITIGVAVIGDRRVSAHPNPSETGVFTLSSKVNGAVLDLTGRVIMHVTASSNIDLSPQPAGYYFLRTDEGHVTRLIK